MRLIISHSTLYTYMGGSSRAAMLLKLCPRSFDGHRVEEWAVTVNGEPVPAFTRNGYGDMESLWVQRGWLDEADIIATGIVETHDCSGLVSGLEERANPMIYLRQTPLTRSSAAIAALAGQGEGLAVLDRLHAISAAIRGAVEYRAGVTGPDTPAAASVAMGAGVCQDHAHIFITAARYLGVPARYVTGYLMVEEQGEAMHETHAWSEALVPGLGWVGFDTSNGVSTTDHYVRVAGGMDAHDAAPVRGSVHAAGHIAISADVRIAPGGDEAHDRQLQKQQQQQTIFTGG